MAAHLCLFLLLLAGLTGSHSATKVTRVSVQARGSVTVPCRYQVAHANNLKYLCQGNTWVGCSTVVKTTRTESSRRSGKFSITDDKLRHVFNATIGGVSSGDTGYWCIVEIDSGTDLGDFFQLAVTSGTSDLSVDRQEVIGYTGGSVTIRCFYQTAAAGAMGWCRLGSGCITGPSGTTGGTKATINSTSPGVFVVTLSGVTLQSSGWYMCVKGDLQMPVHLTVTEGIKTTTTPTTVPGDTGEPGLTFPLEMLLIPLGVLIFVVMVTVLIWFMLKKREAKNSQSSSARSTNPCGSDVDLMYSSVTFNRSPKTKMVEAPVEEVTYSQLALRKS